MKLGYIILYVQDVEATVLFYERAFKLQRRFLHESGTYAEMETGSTALAFASESLIATTCQFRQNRAGGLPAGAEIAFVADDVPAAFASALAEGALSTVEPVMKPWGQVVSYVRDLNGFLVEICSAMG